MSVPSAINHISVEIEAPTCAEDLAFILNSAPLGEINPALEAAVATARFLAGMTSRGEYVQRLRRQIEASSPSAGPATNEPNDQKATR